MHTMIEKFLSMHPTKDKFILFTSCGEHSFNRNDYELNDKGILFGADKNYIYLSAIVGICVG